MAASVYLADTSVYVLRSQHESVRRRVEALLTEERLASCQMVALEYLDNAPDVHRQLAARSQHRHFRLPDLIIAAAAELAGATVLHYDEDDERIAAVTGQPVEWVAQNGSL